MHRGFGSAGLRGRGARDHTVTVRPAPHFLQMRSPTLLEDAVAGPTAWPRFAARRRISTRPQEPRDASAPDPDRSGGR